jgi:threonine dehydrogenase-like Zn-dependent dehydrogenase
MPLEIVTTDGREFRYREYSLPEPGPDDVRVRVEFAAPKHGTESASLAGTSHKGKRWDGELRMFLPVAEAAPAAPSERRVGNTVVGVVTAAGSGVTRFRPGDRVFAYGPICEAYQLPESRWRMLDGLSEEEAVCADPAHVALVGVRDGNLRIGDQVAVYGLGAIGLLAAQIARAAGASLVVAVDPVPGRRELALAQGADLALDPREGDVALAIKRATGNQGVDVALEVSASGAALHEAIRCVRQCGTVVQVAWGPKDGTALHLDEEFHVNRPTLIASQAVWSNPDRSAPLWDQERARLTAIDLFRRRLITATGILTPIIPFGEAAGVLAGAFHSPEQGIKVGVTFPSS